MVTENIVTVGALARFEAKPGNEADVERFFLEGLPIVQRQPASTVWFAFLLGPTTFGAFANEEDRRALLSIGGPVLAERNSALFAQPPTFEKNDVLAAKLPGGANSVTVGSLVRFEARSGKEADWGARILGINGVFTTSVIVIHAVWSAAIPILLTELLFPDRRTTPYLGRGGLVVTSIIYVLGVVLLWLVAHASFATGYTAPAILPGLAVLAALALGVVALGVLPRKAPRPRLQVDAPHPWVVLLVIGISGFTWQASQFLWAIQPLFSDWPLVLVPMLGTLLIGVGVAWLVSRWSRAQDWGDLHLLALASGAVICHILIGLLAYTQTTADRIGLIVLGLAMMGWLTWLAFHIHSRIFSQDRSVKKIEETIPVSDS